MLHRSSGILMPLSSLPSPYGIGTMGAPARRLVDFLAEAGQRWWQLLPLVPMGEGGSPYMSCSAFAGDPLYLDLEDLFQQGLITREELDSQRLDTPDRTDLPRLRALRMPLLHTAWMRARPTFQPDNFPWLEEYACFRARQSGDPDEADFQRFLQTLFFRQWDGLREYARQRGVLLMGDLPIYLAPDSAEVWAHPELFQLDSRGHLSAVAGVPPDAFSPTGQLWGNPLYDWEGHHAQVFSFWQQRIRWAARMFDGVRIDHFRAFHTYWSVPAQAETAMEGRWLPGPGKALVDALRSAAPELFLVAEDLGDLDADARAFLPACSIPGMRVLTFAFDSGTENPYLPHNCPENSVAYTGTHDTPTFVQFLSEAAPAVRDFAFRYLRLREDEGLGWGALAGVWGCPSRLAIAPLQDVLGLGRDARMNTPGTVSPDNWSWRVRQEALNCEVARRLRLLTETYGRLN